MPPTQPRVAGQNIRLGNGSVNVFASHSGNEYRTTLEVHGLHLRSLEIGHTLPTGSTPATVLVDGQPAQNAKVQSTNRGVEVTVPVQGDGPHTLVVTTA